MKNYSSFITKFKAIKAVVNLSLITQGSFFYRIKTIRKFYPLYIYHVQRQNQLFQENIAQFYTLKQQKTYNQQIKQVYSKYFDKIKGKTQNSFNQLKQKQKSQYQKEVRGIIHKGLEYLSLYYESIQSLIEGRRQVIQNQGFLFQDGQTVEQKKIKFQKFFVKLLGRSQKQVKFMEQRQKQQRNSQL